MANNSCLSRLQYKLGNILRSPSFTAFLKRLEISFRFGFRWGITPIFVMVAVAMMSGVAYYWFELIQPAWEHPRFSPTWCLNTGMGIWLLFNVGWNYFRCMLTPSFHPLPLDQHGKQKRMSDCAEILSVCGCGVNTVQKGGYVAAKTEEEPEQEQGHGQSPPHHHSHSATQRHSTFTTPSSSSNVHTTTPTIAPSITPHVNEINVDAWNYCKRCDLITPPRAMHCFLCNRCVLGMDHHCPWLATCIGYHNHAYFFLFLFYVVIGCLYLCTWTVPMFYSIIMQKNYGLWHGVEVRRDRFALTMLGVLPTTFIVAVGGMMLWHGIILACGATSLEFKVVLQWIKDYMVGGRIQQIFCKCWNVNGNDLDAMVLNNASSTILKGKKRRHPFDQGGLIENWKETFGVRGYSLWWIWWCMPIPHTRSGNGIDKFLCEMPGVTRGKTQIV